MTITDAKLSAYIDGELADSELDMISQALQQDAMLARRVEQLKNSNHLIVAAYSDIDKTPMPQAVLDMLESTDTDERPENIALFPFHHLPKAAQQWAMPIAASMMLVVGLGLGMQITSKSTTIQRDKILAAGVIDKTSPLHHALEKVASLDTYIINATNDAAITPSLTFMSINDDYCREFTVTQHEMTSRAVACRKTTTWEIQLVALVPAKNVSSGGYSTASAGFNAQFDEFVDGLILDEPLDADEERALLNKW